MLVDSFTAVVLERADLPDLQWTGIARLLDSASARSASAGDTGGEDGAQDSDTVACLRVSGSNIASVSGLQGYRSLLALAVPRNALSSLYDQVCHGAAARK